MADVSSSFFLSLAHSALTRSRLRHAPLSKVDLVGLAPDLEVAELLDGEPVGEHQHHVLLVVLSYPHLHLRVGSAMRNDAPHLRASLREGQSQLRWILLSGVDF